MKKLMQVDLSSLATEVETKKRVYKKRKIVEGLEESVEVERPEKGGKSIKSFPIKEKKPPTEKQLAAREKMRLARAAKIEQVKAEKAKLDEEIRLKEEEVLRKKEELAEKRRLKREEKKKEAVQKPVIQSQPGKTGEVEDRGPTISEALKTIQPVEEKTVQFSLGRNEQPSATLSTPKEIEVSPGNIQGCYIERQVPNYVPSTHDYEPCDSEPTKSPQRSTKQLAVPDAPKRTYVQRFKTFPFGKSLPVQPRFR